eukprot:jgi/Phyca11/117864/e_gw1.34.274.1
MIFACGLPLNFWGDAVQYAAYILNRSPSNSNAGRASPLKVLTKQTPSLGEIVVFGSTCTVYRDPRNKNFSQRAQQGMIVGIGEETKGYRVYLPKDRIVVTTQHVKNIETLSKDQNIKVQRLYLRDDDEEEQEESAGATAGAGAGGETRSGARKTKKTARKKAWQRERHVTRSVMKMLKAENSDELALELQKVLYGLKQAGRLWSKFLHQKLVDVGFKQSLTDMCVYCRLKEGVLIVVGVYVDDLLVTGTQQNAVDAFFGELTGLAVKDLGSVSKFLGMRVTYSDDDGYDLDQEVGIAEMLREYGMELANGVRTPMGAEWNEADATEILPVSGGDGCVTVRRFQSLVGSLMWVARCTRPDITFAVHKA